MDVTANTHEDISGTAQFVSRMAERIQKMENSVKELTTKLRDAKDKCKCATFGKKNLDSHCSRQQSDGAIANKEKCKATAKEAWTKSFITRLNMTWDWTPLLVFLENDVRLTFRTFTFALGHFVLSCITDPTLHCVRL